MKLKGDQWSPFFVPIYITAPILAIKVTTFPFIANLFKISDMHGCENNSVDNSKHMTMPPNSVLINKNLFPQNNALNSSMLQYY